MSRQQKEESLYRDIPEYFEAEFELLDICFNDDDGNSFVVMKEVQDIIRTLEKPDVKESILFMNTVRFTV